MIDKRCSLEEAVASVQDGQTLALGGLTLYRRPVSLVRALIQRPRPPQALTLLAFTAGPAADMLVGAGLVRQTRTCYFGLESFGLAPMFTQAAQTGAITVIEESEASIANGLRAFMGGIGFLPSRAWQGTDMLAARPDVKTVVDPYSGQTLTAFPAIRCDVAFIHVLRADYAGNCLLGGNPTIDLELTAVADTVIISAEEVVEKLRGPIDIAGLPVTAVVPLPGGAWPSSCYPHYPIDGEGLLDYIDACHNGRFDDFVRQRQPPPNFLPDGSTTR